MAVEVSRVPAAAVLRQQRGISLEEIADATKISLRFLRAIEAGNADELPEGVFRISYVRQYATYVGVDEADLLARLAPPPVVQPEQAASRSWLRRLF